MNFGFRYHLASLMAVFFSLIFGILIGGALFTDNSLVEEQGLVISELEERFREVQTNLGSLQAELDFYSSAWGQLRDNITQNRLAAKIVVLVDNDDTKDNKLLEGILHLSGADVKKVKAEDVKQITPSDEIFFVFRLPETEVSSSLIEDANRLAMAGANLAFVWGAQEQPVLKDLPPSLQIDSVDTAMGEIALILGLAMGSRGHYGMHAGSERLFP